MLVGAVVVVVLAAGGGTVVLLRHGPDAPTAPAAVAVQTATVQRTDLANSQSYAGTLGFGDPQAVTGSGGGVLTQLPAVGAIATRGQPLYWVNDQPVPLFFGATPLFRTLDTPGLQGNDVAMLESNLIALGYYHGTVPKNPRQATLTANMLAGLKNWQTAVGMPATGTLAVGQVLVVPGPARVSAVTAQLGAAAAGDIMALTSTQKLVTIAVTADQLGTIATGAAATIQLPTGGSTTGAVTAISAAATSASSQSGAGSSSGQDGSPMMQVTITPDSQPALGSLVTASVNVQITTVVHHDVLAVPIAALLALREGGYALQLPDGRLIPVQTGLFTDQLVEVSGPGVVAGLRVVTAS